MVPRRRANEAAHEVAAFQSVRAAVNSYFKNINTHAAYKDLRSIRADLRRQQKPIDATKQHKVYCLTLNDVKRTLKN